MGDLDYNTSSLSLIVGPPGTGKSTCITLLLGALMNLSVCGHLYPGSIPFNSLRRTDNCIHASQKAKGINVSICAASNAAVNNVARRLSQAGIPFSGNEEKRFVDIVRIGRHRYEYKDMKEHSLQGKALEFYHKVFHPSKDPKRNTHRTGPYTL